MVGQFGGMLRCTVNTQIPGARAHGKVNIGEFTRNQARVAQFTDTYGEIDILRDQVESAVIQIDLDPDLGVKRHEFAYRSRELADAEAQRQRQSNASRNRGLVVNNRLLGILQVAQQLGCALIKLATGIGHRLTPGSTLQQLHTEPALEFADAATDHRLGDAELFSGVAKALVIDDGNVGLQFFKAIHIVLFLAIIFTYFRYLLSIQNNNNSPILTKEAIEMESKTIRVLRLDASANPQASASRKLGDHLLRHIGFTNQKVEVRERDLNSEAQFIDAGWIEANFSAADERNAMHKARLVQSDRLIAELEWADHIVLTTPMYNFGIPATLKAWVDQVCRAGVTFRYSAEGPVGLLEGKRADIVITTGGAPLDSPVDFVSGYLRQVFAFIGISEVEIIGADGMAQGAEQSIAGARRHIEQRYPASAA